MQPALNWIIDTALPTAISAVLDLADAFGSVVLTALEFKEVLIAAAAVYGAFKAGKALQSMIQGFQQAKVTLALFKASAQGATIAQAAFQRDADPWRNADRPIHRAGNAGAAGPRPDGPP